LPIKIILYEFKVFIFRDVFSDKFLKSLKIDESDMCFIDICENPILNWLGKFNYLINVQTKFFIAQKSILVRVQEIPEVLKSNFQNIQLISELDQNLVNFIVRERSHRIESLRIEGNRAFLFIITNRVGCSSEVK